MCKEKKKKTNIMINYIEVTGGNTQECNLHWPKIHDHPFKILIVGSSGSGKTNVLLYLITQKTFSEKIYLYNKDPSEHSYQFPINKHDDVGQKH